MGSIGSEGGVERSANGRILVAEARRQGLGLGEGGVGCHKAGLLRRCQGRAVGCGGGRRRYVRFGRAWGTGVGAVWVRAGREGLYGAVCGSKQRGVRARCAQLLSPGLCACGLCGLSRGVSIQARAVRAE